jgi:hypothetical protein
MNEQQFDNIFYNNVKKNILDKCKFKIFYCRFNKNKNEKTYNDLINYIVYKFNYIKSNYITNTKIIKQYIRNLIFYDSNNKIIFNSYFIANNQNNYSNYVSNKIIDNTNGFILNRIIRENKYIIGKIYSKNIVYSFPDTTVETSSSWKQTCYVGYYMDYDSFNSFIDVASSNGITHIILEFIILILNNNGTNDSLTFADTVTNWASFSSSQQTTLLNKIRNAGMQLVASFGGATSFTGGFQQVLNSPNYYNPNTLATDLVNWLYTNNIPAIDLDIEFIPSVNVYPNTLNLVNYLGELSASIKQLANTKFGYYPIVSHAPQTPYFNGSYFGYIYNQLEQLYGSSIDFYNIQFYNQGNYSYTTYDGIFTLDNSFNASVLQLINASTINTLYSNIPGNKIVVGKPSNENEVSIENGFVYLYSTDPTYQSTMTNYVNMNLTSQYTDLVNWYTNGGTMIWIYDIQQNTSYYPNSQLLSYFSNTKH